MEFLKIKEVGKNYETKPIQCVNKHEMKEKKDSQCRNVVQINVSNARAKINIGFVSN